MLCNISKPLRLDTFSLITLSTKIHTKRKGSKHLMKRDAILSPIVRSVKTEINTNDTAGYA